MEDVFPPAKQATVAWGGPHHSRSGMEAPRSNYRLKVRALCAKCNNDWLGVLERRTRPRLTLWMRGLHNAMTVKDQRRMSFWAVKTAMMVQIAHARTQRVIPPADYRRLRATGDHPPAGIGVWMALVATRFPGLGFQSRSDTVLPKDAAPYRVYHVILDIHHVRFRIIGQRAQATSNWIQRISQREIYRT